MSVELVLPTLTAWTSSRLTALLTAKTEAEFTTVFDALFAQNVDVTFNGKHLSREQYHALLFIRSSAVLGDQGANVSVQDVLEVRDQGQLSGLVGLFYTALYESKVVFMGAPAERRITSSINVTIQPTEARPQPPNPRIRGYFDPRRVVTVNQIETEEALRFTIPSASFNSNSPDVTTTDNVPEPSDV